MSLATKLEALLAERDMADAISAQLEQRFRNGVATNYDADMAHHKLRVAQDKLRDAALESLPELLAALKFQEAVEWHQLSVYQTPEGEWIASTIRTDATNKWRKAATPAAAVASLVAELEKK